ncbi:MAG: metallophosphoesterase [Eubacterium sp.]
MKAFAIILCFLIIILVLLTRAIWETRNLRITEYDILSENIPDEIAYNKFVLLSDLHNCTYGKDNKYLLNAIDTINPDAVFFAGDLIVGAHGYSFDKGAEFLNNIASKYKVYYAHGNHEARMKQNTKKYGNMYCEFEKKINWNNIVKLENSYYDLCDNVRIYGLEIDNSYFLKLRIKKMALSYMYELLGECDRSKYNILIAHNPRYFDEYSDWGANLVLSGHNHGGIIGIPHTTRGVMSPQYQIFEKYCRGHFTQGKNDMIISAGLGSHTINLRLFNRPEIVVFKLIPKVAADSEDLYT